MPLPDDKWRDYISEAIGEIKALLLSSKEQRVETDRKIDLLIEENKDNRHTARDTAQKVASLEALTAKHSDRLEAIEQTPWRAAAWIIKPLNVAILGGIGWLLHAAFGLRLPTFWEH